MSGALAEVADGGGQGQPQPRIAVADLLHGDAQEPPVGLGFQPALEAFAPFGRAHGRNRAQAGRLVLGEGRPGRWPSPAGGACS